MNSATHIVRFQIITIIVGLSIDKAIGLLIAQHSEFQLLCGAYYLITLLNFYHGKIAATESQEYKVKSSAHSLAMLLDFVLNTCLLGSFLVIAYLLTSFREFLLANVAMRFIDLLLVAIALIPFSGPANSTPLLRRAHLYWGGYNIVTILVIAQYLVHLQAIEKNNDVWYPENLILLGIVDVFFDYAINHRIYFESA